MESQENVNVTIVVRHAGGIRPLAHLRLPQGTHEIDAEVFDRFGNAPAFMGLRKVGHVSVRDPRPKPVVEEVPLSGEPGGGPSDSEEGAPAKAEKADGDAEKTAPEKAAKPAKAEKADKPKA